VPIKNETAVKSTEEESTIDDLFARLISQGALQSPSDMKPASPSRPRSGTFSFGDDFVALDDATKATSTSGAAVKSRTSVSSTATVVPKQEENKDMSHADIEQLYLRKATDYLEALPSGNNVSVQMIKAVSAKLRCTYAVDAQLSGDEIERLKARYAFAIQNYVKQVYKKNTKPVTSDYIKKVLQDTNADLLQVCARLVDGDLISLQDMDNVAGLCKMIHHVLPKPETTVSTSNNDPATPSVGVPATQTTTTPFTSKNAPSTTVQADRKLLELVPALKDPLEGLKTWPTQEKRETCE
jgi:hypothetical protein